MKMFLSRFNPKRCLSALGLGVSIAAAMGAYVEYKDLRTNNLTVTGTLSADTIEDTTANRSFSGNFTLGDAAADTITFNGTMQGASPLVFEGSTADAFEGTLAVADVTADVTWTAPDASGTIMLSALSTNAPDAANSVTGGSNKLILEGATADAFELFLAPTDPTADRTVTFADASGTAMLSSLSTNAPDAANGVSGASNGLVFEGATANGFETTVTPTDPTADRTVTLPDATGTAMIAFASGTDAVASGDTSKAVTVTGALTTDIAIVTLKEVASNAVSIRAAIMTADTLTVHLTGDPGASNCDFDYIIVRD